MLRTALLGWIWLAGTVASCVTPVPAGPLLGKANYNDLDGRSLVFQPEGDAYRVLVRAAGAIAANRGTQLAAGGFVNDAWAPGWRVTLPFEFPFAGSKWREIYVNLNGTITFGQPESVWFAARSTWPDGTLTTTAAQIDLRSVGGAEKMIAVFWGLTAPSGPSARAWTLAAADAFTVTWETDRRQLYDEGYAPLGRCLFQAQLTPDGAVTMTYFRAPEKDAVVGLFHGQIGAGTLLDEVDDPADTDVAGVDIRNVKVEDAGRYIKYTMVAQDNILTRAPEGNLWYRIFSANGDVTCDFGLFVNTTSSSPYGNKCPAPAVRVNGRVLEVFQSKEIFPVDGPAVWGADSLWVNRAAGTLNDRVVLAPFRRLPALTFPSATVKLTALDSPVSGNVYEIFRYPYLPKSQQQIASYIYSRLAVDDELLLLFTDFRFDDVHNHGSSTGAMNVPIRGIGVPPGAPRDLTGFGSKSLQVAIQPAYVGGPRFSETGTTPVLNYKNYAQAVGWTGHELFHRWSAFLPFRNPNTADVNTLRDTACACHWNDFLDTRSRFSVWPMFSDKPYNEVSVMAGGYFDDQGNGMFVKRPVPYLFPAGFSDLDLYAAGLLPAEDVKDTFLIANATLAQGTTYRGTRVRVGIDGILAAAGARSPTAQEAQKSFKLGMYLLYEDGRDVDPEMLARAQGIEANLIAYYDAATGGALKLNRSVPLSRIDPGSVVLVSGGDQSGRAGAALSNPLVFEVRSQAGVPLANVSIMISAMNAAVDKTELATGADGRAGLKVTLGDAAGEATIVAAVAGLDPLQVTLAVQ